MIKLRTPHRTDIWINPDHIISMVNSIDDETWLYMTDEKLIYVTETPDEISRMIDRACRR